MIARGSAANAAGASDARPRAAAARAVRERRMPARGLGRALADSTVKMPDGRRSVVIFATISSCLDQLKGIRRRGAYLITRGTERNRRPPHRPSALRWSTNLTRVCQNCNRARMKARFRDRNTSASRARHLVDESMARPVASSTADRSTNPDGPVTRRCVAAVAQHTTGRFQPEVRPRVISPRRARARGPDGPHHDRPRSRTGRPGPSTGRAPGPDGHYHDRTARPPCRRGMRESGPADHFVASVSHGGARWRAFWDCPSIRRPRRPRFRTGSPDRARRPKPGARAVGSDCAAQLLRLTERHPACMLARTTGSATTAAGQSFDQVPVWNRRTPAITVRTLSPQQIASSRGSLHKS